MKAWYDLLAATLLALLLLIALVAWVLHGLADAVATFTGHGDQVFLWKATAQDLSTSPEVVRLVLFGGLHGLILVALSPVLRRGFRAARARFLAPPPKGRRKKRASTDRRRLALEIGGSAMLTLALVPLVVQPTLVPLSLASEAWVERAANVADGQASREALGSMVAAWRWVASSTSPSRFAVTPDGLNDTLRTGDGPMMARWDPILEAATDDREHFAQTKAFMWVESAGRQYAVSHTGCAGLMQFCVTTAQRQPFRRIFGVGQVSACGCRGCQIPRAVQDALETDPEAIRTHRAAFPCAPGDARFDPDKAIRAGAAYVRELSDALGNNLPLMYIGYNSGPAVAQRVFVAVGRDGGATLDDLRPHLAPALRRYYGASAEGRARGLLDTHLPKLQRAYERYL